MAYPTLNQNKIFAALYNQIISIDTFADNIKGTNSKLVDAARVDGGLYGDTKVYIATDILKSAEWGNDAEASNLLALHRPKAPETQTITLDKFRQAAITVDNYLSKQAFATEGAFAQFNSVIRGQLADTKKVYDSTTYNAFFGTCESQVGTQSIDIPLSTITAVGEEKHRLEAEMIAESLANLMTQMTDVSRDFNDYGFLRSYNAEDIKVVWNSKFVNKIKKIDLPTIFHKEGLVDKFEQYVLPERYFGEVNAGATQGNGTTVRSLIEQEIGTNHYFAGDLIKTSDTAPAGTSYTVDAGIVCKVVVKLPPFMSAFETSTSFFNPKSLTETNFLTWGHNTLDYLKNYPMVTVHAE